MLEMIFVSVINFVFVLLGYFMCLKAYKPKAEGENTGSVFYNLMRKENIYDDEEATTPREG